MTKFYRSVKIAFQYMYRNFGLSFASVVVMTLSFFIVSVVGIAFYGSYTLAQYVDSKPALVVYLRGDLSEDQAKQFSDIVNDTGLAKNFSIKNIDFSREDFARIYPDAELQDLLSRQDAKKYFPIVTFIYSDSQQNLQELIKRLEVNHEFMENLVDKTNANEVWYSFDVNQANVIRDANRLISVAGAVVTAFLFIISSILVFITIKLAINYHKREIEIMDLVGAEGWFIRLPFVIDGIIYGVVGAILSTTSIFIFRSLVLRTSQSFVPKMLSYFGEVPWPTIDTKLLIELYAVTIFVGAFVGAISSFFAIIRYVKK